MAQQQWHSVFGASCDVQFQLVERLSGSLSLCGSVFIIVTFLCFPAFDKSFNRLAFYASFGNIFASLAALISLDGPRAGSAAGLCQFQGFLVQMMIPADAYWILAMAINVHLVFFHCYTASDLRRLEWGYIAACYGFPAIPAITLLLIPAKKGGVKVYGDAAIWCWIGHKFEHLRLPLGYGPVGVTIILVFVIHIRAVRMIWSQRRRIREASAGGTLDLGKNNSHSTGGTSRGPEVVKTTHDHVTHEHISATSNPSLRPGRSQAIAPEARDAGYSVNIEFDDLSSSHGPHGPPNSGQQPSAPGRAHANVLPNRPQNAMTRNVNKAAVVYFRCAALFFLALVVTWVPSFANRLLTTVNPSAVNYPLALAAAVSLPLQGFWGALIYTVNSLEACAELWESVRCRFLSSMTRSAEEIVEIRGNALGGIERSGMDATVPRRIRSPSERMRSLNGSGVLMYTHYGGRAGSPTLGKQ